MLKSEVEFWKNVILSGKKYEPQNREQAAAFDIAFYMINNLPQKKEKLAA